MKILYTLLPILFLIYCSCEDEKESSEYLYGAINVNECSPISGNTTKFVQSFGDSGAEKILCVQQTTDDGFVMVGWMHNPESSSDVWFIKIDSEGNEQWNKTFDGNYFNDIGNTDHAKYVHQTADGGYSIVGFQSFTLGDHQDHDDVWLIKTDSQGNGEWDYTYGTAGGSWDNQQGMCHQLTSDGGYIIVGDSDDGGPNTTSSEILLLKVNSQGDQEWIKTFGGSQNDYGRFVQETQDGGYILTGYTYSFGSGDTDIILIKTDANGNEEWYKTYGGNSGDQGYFLLLATDGGYVFGGGTSSFGSGETDAWVIKTDYDGNVQWEKTYGGEFGDWAYSCQYVYDGGYIIGGFTNQNGIYNTWLLKIDEQGNMEWSRGIGGDNIDICYSVQQTSDCGFVIAGQTYSFGDKQGLIVKTDPDGNTVPFGN